MKTNRNRIGGIVVAACAVLAGGSVRAQPALQFTTVDVNYVYAASLGFGGYAIGGLTANVYTLPLSTSWQNVPFDGWTLKFLLPVQLGLYEFKAAFQGHDISLSQQSVTAVPGAELQIPVSSRFVVKPFVQGGAGHSFGTGGGNPDAWVYLTGVRSVAQWDAGGYTFSLGNGVIFAGDASVGPGFGEHYLTLQIAGEVRRPLGLRIGGFAPDLGVYAAEYYYPTALRFSRFLQPPLLIRNQNEVGFSVGSAEPMKILWLANPRIGAGIAFGGGLTVYRINFGFPF